MGKASKRPQAGRWQQPTTSHALPNKLQAATFQPACGQQTDALLPALYSRMHQACSVHEGYTRPFWAKRCWGRVHVTAHVLLPGKLGGIRLRRTPPYSQISRTQAGCGCAHVYPKKTPAACLQAPSWRTGAGTGWLRPLYQGGPFPCATVTHGFGALAGSALELLHRAGNPQARNRRVHPQPGQRLVRAPATTQP